MKTTGPRSPVPADVTLSRGVKVSGPKVDATLDAAARLQAVDPTALFALREHALDAGYTLTDATLSALRKAGLADDSGVSPHTRAIVADFVAGHGLDLSVKGRAAGAAGVPGAPGVFRGPLATRIGADVVDDARAGRADRAAKALLGDARALVREAKDTGRRVDVGSMLRFTAAAATLVDKNGAARPELQGLLVDAQKVFGDRLSRPAALLFYDLAAMTGARLDRDAPGVPPMPLRRVPYWQKEAHPLDGFQSTPKLPEEADVVIVGAGLTGGAAALHIADEAKKRGLKVVLLDAGNVASQASGRNGGNLEAIPENFFGAYGTYDGYAEERYKFLKASYPHLPEDVLRAQANRIAETIIRFAYKNAKLLNDDIKKNDYAVDQSMSGWLRLALNKREEQALKNEVAFAKKLGIDMGTISPALIKKRYNLDSKFHGRLTGNNGNFHPFKFVVKEVQTAVDKGVLLYTETKVGKIESKSPTEHLLQTDRGTIKAGKVILATNAFTSDLLPQLKDIQPFRSQIVNFHHTRNDLNGITFTAKDGDIYGNFPRQDWYKNSQGQQRGTLHLGGGMDTRVPSAEGAEPSRKVFQLIEGEAKQVFPDLKDRVPARTWAGPMAFVEGKHGMRMPVIGELGPGNESGILLSIWCNGYGGTGCHKTGYEAARWALDGKLSDDVPEDVFGVARLLSDEPMFDPARGGPRPALTPTKPTKGPSTSKQR
ncbi:MAG: FAD-binding oxidoreductase [Deltaproteobacteria bacterium]|nr:FAD-binding oxidoreductase [Deltaproteobacteria bacterium]